MKRALKVLGLLPLCACTGSTAPGAELDGARGSTASASAFHSLDAHARVIESDRHWQEILEDEEVQATDRVLSGLTSDGSAWPQPGFSRSQSRANNRETMITTASVSGLRQKFHVAARTQQSQPLIANGRLYVELCSETAGPCDQSTMGVYSLNDGHLVGSQSGLQLMAYAFGGFFSVKSHFDGEGSQGWLTRWAPDLGGVTWTDPNQSYNDASGNYTGMIAADERVYMLWSDTLVAYDAHPERPGAAAPFVMAGPGAEGPIHMEYFTPAFGTDRVFLTSGDTLYAFDPAQVAAGNCHAIAKKQVAGEQLYWVSIASGIVIVDAGSKLIAFDAVTLEEKWRTPHAGRAFPSLAISGGRIFETTNAGDLRALELRTGAVEWQVHVTNAFLSAPSVGADLVWVHGATLSAFSTSCGTDGQVCSPTWSASVDGSSPATVAAGHVVVSSGAGIDVFSLP